VSNTTEERKVRFDSVVRVSDDLRSILSWSLEVAQPHETSKDPFMVDAPTFNLCTPCSGLCCDLVCTCRVSVSDEEVDQDIM